MTKKLQIAIDKPEIEIELGDLTLVFPIDDDSMIRIRKQTEGLQEAIKAIEEKYKGQEMVDFTPHKELLTTAYDNFFGAGTFEQVYQQTPNVNYCTIYFLKICEQLTHQISFDQEYEKASKQFLRKKAK